MADGSLIFDTGLDNSGFKKGITTLTTAAVTAAAAITTAFTGAAAAAVKVGSSFTASMSQVAATMGIDRMSEDYELLAQAAEDMGASTKFSATQAGDALNYLALAGYDAQRSVAALPTVLNVAAAGGIDLAYASDMITDSMSALGLSMGELESFSDKLAKASQKSNTSVAQLGEAILTVGGTAKTLSGGVTELNTMLGLIADNGIKGAEGGTALRNIILSLSAPTDTAAAAMERLNFSAFDSAGNMRNLAEVFADLNTSLAPLTEQQKTQALNEIFNKVDLKAVNALLGTSSERFAELAAYIEDSEGAAAQMAETMNDNLSGDIVILRSALEGLGVAAFDKFETPMRTAVQSVTEDVSALTAELKDGGLSDSFDKISESAGRLVKNLGSFLTDKALPTVINSMAVIIEHGESIINILTSIAVGIAAFKGITAFTKFQSAIRVANLALLEMEASSGGAAVAQAYLAGKLTVTQIAAGIYSGKITAATVVTAAFKTVVNSPILLASILIGVVTAVAKFTNSISEATDITKNAKQAAEDYNSALEQQNKQLLQNNSNLESDKTMLNNKIAIYEKLRKQYEETGQGEQDLIDITKEIQELSPVTIQFIDEETQKYISLAGAVDDVVTAMERKYKLQNAESDWEFAQDELSELYNQKEELNKEREQFEQDFQDKYGISSDHASFANTFAAYSIIDALAIGYAKRRINENEDAMLEINTAIADAEARSASAMKTITDTYVNNSNEESASFYMSAAETHRMAGQKYADTIKTENEKMLQQWKENTEKLEAGFEKYDHQYNTGVIKSETELYEKKKALLKKYGSENFREHWKFYEEIYGYEKDFAEASAKLEEERQKNIGDTVSSISSLVSQGVKENTEQSKEALKKQLEITKSNLSSIVSEYSKAMSDLQSNISSYKNRLLSVGNIFSVEETEQNGKKVKNYTIENINRQMSAMKKYHSYIKELKKSGASQGLLEELTSLDFEDGAQFGKYLSGLSDKEFNKINDYYKERDALADELSKDLYAGEAEKYNSILMECVNKSLEQLPLAAQTAGKAMLNGIMEGMTGSEDLSEKMSSFVEGFSEVWQSALEDMNPGSSFAIALGGIDTYSMGQDMAKRLMNGFNEELARSRAEVSVSQSAAAVDLSSGSAARTAETKSGSKKGETITVDNTTNITVQIDGETVSRTTERKRTEKERRTG